MTAPLSYPCPLSREAGLCAFPHCTQDATAAFETRCLAAWRAVDAQGRALTLTEVAAVIRDE